MRVIGRSNIVAIGSLPKTLTERLRGARRAIDRRPNRYLAIKSQVHHAASMSFPIEPNLLLTLGVLLKTKSVSGAAAILGVSQPSVSRALGQLRGLLNDPLLVRSGNVMVRTRRGDELVDRLADWMVLTSDLLTEAAFDPKNVKRRFRIGTTDFGVLSVLLPSLPAVQANAPGLAIDIVPLTRATHRSLAAGEIDLAISGLDHDPSQLHSLLLFKESFSCVMQREHPLAGNVDTPVPLHAFLAYPHIGLTVSDAELDRVTEALGPAARDRHVIVNIPYFSLAPALLMKREALMTLPTRAADHFSGMYDLAVRPAPEGLGQMDYWLLWHERSHRDPASTWLREQLAAPFRGKG